MTAVRDIGDYQSGANGDGQSFTTAIRESLVALWGLNAGLLVSVAGTNAITGDLLVSGGFTAPSDGMEIAFVAVKSNTGAMTLDPGSTGAKGLVLTDGTAAPAGTVISGSIYTARFIAASDHWRLQISSGTTNVTVQGGILLQRSLPTLLAASVAETTSETQLLSRAFQAGYTTSRIVVEGSISRKHATGTDDDDGLSIALFVDGASEQTRTDGVYTDLALNTPFSFEYEPGDASAHTYSIRATSTLGAKYHASSTYMVVSEYSPND